jgi:hypothetical protein
LKSKVISQVNVEAGPTASLPTRYSFKPSPRQTSHGLLMALILSLLLIPAAQLQSKAQAIVPEYIPLNADQLDQLVAPIALDPDPLVAQILIGSTFPDQVSDANNWLSTKMNLSPDQRAAGANSMNWDPSIKGLIVFPLVLDSMAKNDSWTTQLGNAYYNQPDDVMSAIQAMRSLAYQSHALVATSQQNVVVTADLVEILPVSSDAVYVEYYNPWTVFGTEVAAYPGFVVEPAPAGVVVADGVSFEPAVSVGLDTHFGFSFGGWAPGWGGGGVVYNHNAYYSNSRTVANRDHFGGRDGRAFEHGGRSIPAGYHHDGRQGFGGRLPISRPMPQRGFNPKATPVSHVGSSTRSSSTNHSYSPNRIGARNASNARTTSVAHSTSAGRLTSSNHSNAANRPAARNTSNARSNSTGRSTTGQSAGRSPSGNRSTSQPAANRSISQSRSTTANRPVSRPVSANSSTGANRPMSRPAATNSSVGGGQSMNRPAAANRAAGPSPSMSHPASMVHSGGAGFGGGTHMGGGGKKR